MNVLGFDTSTAATSACLMRDGSAFELLPPPAALHEPPAHARELLPAMTQVMSDAGVDWAQLDALAVGVGPGTFTGLRIGIATARAIAGARAIPLHPVSSLAALAAGLEAPLRLPLIDARRGELFAALWEDGVERWPAFVAAPDELGERVRTAGLNPLAAGDGSLRFRLVLEAAGIEVAGDESSLHLVRASSVCRLAAEVPPVPPEAIVPNYLREPDVTQSP